MYVHHVMYGSLSHIGFFFIRQRFSECDPKLSLLIGAHFNHLIWLTSYYKRVSLTTWYVPITSFDKKGFFYKMYGSLQCIKDSKWIDLQQRSNRLNRWRTPIIVLQCAPCYPLRFAGQVLMLHNIVYTKDLLIIKGVQLSYLHWTFLTNGILFLYA